MVPMLVIFFGFPIPNAVGTSLTAIVITSAGASSVYLKRGEVSIPAAYRLELFTAVGATVGGLLAGVFPNKIITVVFGVILLFTAYKIARKSLGKNGNEFSEKSPSNDKWDFQNVPSVRRIWGYLGGLLAGVVSALLGVGGGIIKVPLLNLIFNAPIRTATATSSFMIGITASASAVHYLFRGYVNPLVASIVAGSIFIGARFGAIIAPKIKTAHIRIAFSLILLYTAIKMILQG